MSEPWEATESPPPDGMHVRASKFDISILPDEHPERHVWTLYVEYRGPNSWCVTTGFRDSLSRNGEWDYEAIPSERRDEWLADHRFTLDEALQRAYSIAPGMMTNNCTAEQALERFVSGWYNRG